MRLEYIILIVLATAFYITNIKEYRISKIKTRYVDDNLKVSSKIITKSGIIGYVYKIDENIITIITGEDDNLSYLTLEKSYIDSILE